MRTSMGMRLHAFMTDDDVAIVLSQSQIAGRDEADEELGSNRVTSLWRTFGRLQPAVSALFSLCKHPRLRLSRGRWPDEDESMPSTHLPPDIDTEKLAEVAIAILSLTLHDGGRAWKSLDWDLMELLWEKGWIVEARYKGEIRGAHRKWRASGERIPAETLWQAARAARRPWWRW